MVPSTNQIADAVVVAVCGSLIKFPGPVGFILPFEILRETVIIRM